MIREEEVYKIGMLTKTHGVSGELSLSFTDDVFDRVDADYLVCKMDGILVPFFMEEYRFKNDTTALVKFADIDTEELIHIASGEFVTTKILNITKGENGVPGKIQGTVENQENIGLISKNTNFGIYGKVTNLSSLNIDSSKEMELALRDEIKTGKAKILCSLDNINVEEYEIEIQKIYKENNYDNKSMKIKITDRRLIEKTGGIIQGMSGSPIIQNNKFVGAVTHVLIDNPTQGYAVFGDIMLKQIK